MKRIIPFVAAASAAVLLGQGCTKTVVSDPPAQPPAASQTSNHTPPQQLPMNTSNLAFPGVLPESETKTHVRLKTTKGDIVLEIAPDQGPNAASNFVYLVKQKFYDGISFHRRVDGFVIQGGDPQGNGTGGPGYKFADDPVKPLGQNPDLKELPADLKAQLPPGNPLLTKGALYKKGTLAMANAGPNTNGSQFFIMLDDAPLTLDYSIFGRVTEGMDVVANIQVGDKMINAVIE